MELTISGSEQLVLNRDRLGFYRVMYDKPGYTWMRQQFLNRSSHLSGVDRAGFLADMVAFASSGRMETTEVMDMLNHLSGETDSLVWEVAAGFMTQLRSLLWEEDEVIQRSLANWMGDIIADTVDSIGFETRKGDTASIQKIRQELLPLMGYAGSPRYLAYSVDILAQVCQGQLESAAGISGSALRAVMGTVSADSSRYREKTTHSDMILLRPPGCASWWREAMDFGSATLYPQRQWLCWSSSICFGPITESVKRVIAIASDLRDP